MRVPVRSNLPIQLCPYIQVAGIRRTTSSAPSRCPGSYLTIACTILSTKARSSAPNGVQPSSTVSNVPDTGDNNLESPIHLPCSSKNSVLPAHRVHQCSGNLPRHRTISMSGPLGWVLESRLRRSQTQRGVLSCQESY